MTDYKRGLLRAAEICAEKSIAYSKNADEDRANAAWVCKDAIRSEAEQPESEGKVVASGKRIATWANGVCKTCGAETHSCRCEHPQTNIFNKLFGTAPHSEAPEVRERAMRRQFDLWNKSGRGLNLATKPDGTYHDTTTQIAWESFIYAWAHSHPPSDLPAETVREMPESNHPAGFITMTLPDRIDAALKRIENNHAPRRIPADQTDVDIVLAECKIAISRSAARGPASCTWPKCNCTESIERGRDCKASRSAEGE